jgi:hypothetical protein
VRCVRAALMNIPHRHTSRPMRLKKVPVTDPEDEGPWVQVVAGGTAGPTQVTTSA